MSDYLKRTYVLKEEIVELQAISTASKASAFDKICVSLINIERETAAGIRFNTISTGGKYYKQSNPSWQLNLYILIAAAF